jgi:hypothetical protein
MLGGSMEGVLGLARCTGGMKNVRNFCGGVVLAQLVRKAAAAMTNARPGIAPEVRIPTG